MKHILTLLACLLGVGSAQFTAPKVSIGLPPELQIELATSIVVQPARVEARLAPGYATAILTLSLFSSVNTEVLIKSNDSRLAIRSASESPVRLTANIAQPVSVVATAPHSGTLTVLNTAGVKIASVPYEVAPAKTVNQGLNLNYSPSSARIAVNYSVSSATPSVLDPRWNASVNFGVNTNTGQLTSSVNIGVNW